ncbi:MAG: hypothetical protein AAEJ52_03480 [Myxococcota bacterium]
MTDMRHFKSWNQPNASQDTGSLDMQGVQAIRFGSLTRSMVVNFVIAAIVFGHVGSAFAEEDHTPWPLGWMGFDYHSSRMSDAAVGEIDSSFIPPRPRRLELGNAFVGTGPISKGWELPTGAIWTPSLLFFGSYRTALQRFAPLDENDELSEWANRLDIFGNLILSGTERITARLRPFDEGFAGPAPQTGRFSGYYFSTSNPIGSPQGEWENEFNADLINLFFEGDIGEMFPNLDPEDELPLDISFTVGRQALFYQEGLLIFDTMDAVGVTKNSIRFPKTSNLQISFLYAWNEINRGDNFEHRVNANGIPTSEQRDLDLYGLFFAVDSPWSTVNLDFVYVKDNSDDQDGLYGGISFVQRVGHLSTALRVVASVAIDKPAPRLSVPAQAMQGIFNTGPTSAVDTGLVIFGELGWTPPHSTNYIYLNQWIGINDYTPAARTPGTGGPMGRAGLLTAGQGLGRYGAPISNFAQDVYAAVLGYQMILDGVPSRRQLVWEIGCRQDLNNMNTRTAATLLRFQQAIGQHILLQLDAFGRLQQHESPGWGSRVELRYAF